MTRIRLALVFAAALVAIQLVVAAQVKSAEYFPPRDTWERRKPADVGMDAGKLDEAIDFMKSHETTSPDGRISGLSRGRRSAGQSLAQLIARIAEMICFQTYNVKSPLNAKAAAWAEKNATRLPLQTGDLTVGL